MTPTTDPRETPEGASPAALDRVRGFFDSARVKGQMLAGALSPKALVRPLVILATAAALATTPVGLAGAGQGVSPEGGTFALQTQMTVDPVNKKLGYGVDHTTGVGTRVDMTRSILNPDITVATTQTDKTLARIEAAHRDKTPIIETTATRTGNSVHAQLKKDSGFLWEASLDRVIDFDAREVCYRAQAEVFFKSLDKTRCLGFDDLPAVGQRHLLDVAEAAGVPYRGPTPPLPPKKPGESLSAAPTPGKRGDRSP